MTSKHGKLWSQIWDKLAFRFVHKFRPSPKGKELLVLKCNYSPHIKNLQLQREYRKLLRRLRQEVGEGLLDCGRLVVAHAVHANAFIATYAYNFPHDDIVCVKKRDTGIREGAVYNV